MPLTEPTLQVKYLGTVKRNNNQLNTINSKMEQLIITIKQEQNKRAYKLKKVINQNTITIKVITSLVK